MKKYIIMTILSLFSLTACSDFLNEGASDKTLIENAYETENDIDIAMRGLYAAIANNSLFGGNMQGRMGLEGDLGFSSYSVDFGTVSDYVVSAGDGKILNYWKAVYRGINHANLILENIDGADISDSKRDYVKAQTHFIRGYLFFMLVDRFGEVPIILEFPKDSSAEAVQKARSPIKRVYDQIIYDLETAEWLGAPDIVTFKGGGHISQSAIWAALARVNLYMAGEPLRDQTRYEQAAMWARKVIEHGHHKLNPSYQEVFINYTRDLYDTKESIFELEFWGNASTAFSSVHGAVGRNNGIYNNSINDEIGYSPGILRATSILIDMYDVADVRKDWNVAPHYYKRNTTDVSKTDTIYWPSNGSKFQRYPGKYRRIYETVTPRAPAATPTNYPLIRYSDVLLMYAEAVNQKTRQDGAEIALAYESINQVRRRAFALDPIVPNPARDITAVTHPIGSALLKEIQNERARELCFELHRKSDLIRWGIFYDKMKIVLLEITPGPSSYLVAARTVYTNATERDVIWPIPVSEIGLNRKLTQNQGW